MAPCRIELKRVIAFAGLNETILAGSRIAPAAWRAALTGYQPAGSDRMDLHHIVTMPKRRPDPPTSAITPSFSTVACTPGNADSSACWNIARWYAPAAHGRPHASLPQRGLHHACVDRLRHPTSRRATRSRRYTVLAACDACELRACSSCHFSAWWCRTRVLVFPLQKKGKKTCKTRLFPLVVRTCCGELFC